MLEELIEQLGGHYSRHLTTRVNILFVENENLNDEKHSRIASSSSTILQSAKCKSARKCGIRLIWCQALTQFSKSISKQVDSFETNTAYDPYWDELVEKWTVQPFYGLRLCFTHPQSSSNHSTDSLEEATQYLKEVYAAKVKSLGGEVSDSLDTSCTHLIVLADLPNRIASENTKVRYAKHWSIPIVKREWLDACIESGGRLLDHDEHLIDVLAEAEPRMSHQTSFKDSQTTDALLCDCLKDCDILLLQNDEAAVGMARSLGAHLADDNPDDLSATHIVLPKDRVLTSQHLIAIKKRTDSKNLQFIVYAEWLQVCFEKQQRLGENSFLAPSHLNHKKGDNVKIYPLSGYTFSIKSPSTINTKLIEELGGRILCAPCADWHLTDKLTDENTNANLITSFWLNAVKEAKRFFDPTSSWYFQPLGINLVSNFKKESTWSFALTGFESRAERQAIQQLITELKEFCNFPWSLTETFSKRNTHLLVKTTACESKSSHDKLAKAKEAGIAIVDLSWLLENITGSIKAKIQIDSINTRQIDGIKVTPLRQALEAELFSVKETNMNTISGQSPSPSQFSAMVSKTPLQGCVMAISHRLWVNQ